MFTNYTVICELSGKEKPEVYPNEVADISINCRPSATSGEIKNQYSKGHKSVVSLTDKPTCKNALLHNCSEINTAKSVKVQ